MIDLNLPGWDILLIPQPAKHTAVIEYPVDPSACSSCGGGIVRYGGYWLTLTDRAFAGVPVKLRVYQRRYKCAECRSVFGQVLPIVDPSRPRSRVTTRLTAWVVAELRAGASLVDIAKVAGFSVDAVEAIGKEAGLAPRPRGRPKLISG